MLTRDPSEIADQAQRIAHALGNTCPAVVIETTDGFSQMGSGSLPAQNLPTTLVAIQPKDVEPDTLAKRLRQYSPPIFARIHKQQMLIDPRKLLAGDEQILIQALAAVLTTED